MHKYAGLPRRGDLMAYVNGYEFYFVKNRIIELAEGTRPVTCSGHKTSSTIFIRMSNSCTKRQVRACGKSCGQEVPLWVNPIIKCPFLMTKRGVFTALTYTCVCYNVTRTRSDRKCGIHFVATGTFYFLVCASAAGRNPFSVKLHQTYIDECPVIGRLSNFFQRSTPPADFEKLFWTRGERNNG